MEPMSVLPGAVRPLERPCTAQSSLLGSREPGYIGGEGEKTQRSASSGTHRGNRVTSRPQTSHARLFSARMHSPPRYDISGQQLTATQGSGLKQVETPLKSLTGKVFIPRNWSRKPNNASLSALQARRKGERKHEQMRTQSLADLNIEKEGKLRGRPSLEETYKRVLSGSAPPDPVTNTRSQMLKTRAEEYSSSISQKQATNHEKFDNDPSREREKLAIKQTVRKWASNAPKNPYEALIAVQGRDREMQSKPFWPKDVSTFLGLQRRENPPFATKSAIIKKRKAEEKASAERQIDEGLRKDDEAAARRAELFQKGLISTSVPEVATQSELRRRRREEWTQVAEKMREIVQKRKATKEKRVMTAPSVPKGFWQKGDRLIDPAVSLTKGSPVRMRSIEQRNVRPLQDPFKKYETSITRMTRARKEKQRTSVELAVIDRNNDQWHSGKSHLPRQASIPMKRWSDVVIEFKQVDEKLDAERLGLDGGGTNKNLSINDTQPLYSSFTKDNIYREPTYGHRGNKTAEVQNSSVLQPIPSNGMWRGLNLMQRVRRAHRFQNVRGYRRRELQEQQARHMRQSASHAISASSLSLGSRSLPDTPTIRNMTRRSTPGQIFHSKDILSPAGMQPRKALARASTVPADLVVAPRPATSTSQQRPRLREVASTSPSLRSTSRPKTAPLRSSLGVRTRGINL